MLTKGLTGGIYLLLSFLLFSRQGFSSVDLDNGRIL
jgi:hypothetical protein